MNTTPIPLAGGRLIVFEGIDGVGKSTQLAMAHKVLKAEKWPLHTTRNLGGTPVGEALREVMLSPRLERPTETNLYIALAIQEALVQAIQTERDHGKIILMDRGPLSLAAYEIYGSGLEKSLGWRYVETAMLELKPDITIIYTADTVTAVKRAKQKARADDYFESQPLAYFERVAAGYLIAAGRYEAQTVLVDAEQPIDLVHQQTMHAIRQALKQ